MAAKLIFDPNDGTILGAQIVGRNGVDKRIDVIATAMAGGITADRLADLELAYAPPFSSAKDPVNMLGYMAENVLSGDCDIVDPERARPTLVDEGWTVIDVRTAEEHAAGAIPGSINVPIDALRDRLDTLGYRTRRRVLRSRSTRTHRDRADARARHASPQPRRRLPDLDGVHAGSGPATTEIGASRRGDSVDVVVDVFEVARRAQDVPAELGDPSIGEAGDHARFHEVGGAVASA